MHMKKLIMLVAGRGDRVGLLRQSPEGRKRTTGGHFVSQGLPDGKYIYNPSLPTLSQLPDPTWVGSESVPNAYGHIFRPLGFVLHPIGGPSTGSS